jgi:voltage-gated potassium channel
MTSATASEPQHGNAYNIFIFVLTIFSLVVMGLLLLPLDPETLTLLVFYDNLICVVFLIDFGLNLRHAQSKREYFFRQGGWLDLIGSVPSLGNGAFRFTALLRLARLSRLARIARLLRAKERGSLVKDLLQNRGQYAFFITILSAVMVLTVASVLVLQFESRGDGNITTGGDALWWGFVTITTVGYGDEFPVTTLGRLVGATVMFAGVGLIGALASILASVLVPPPNTSSAAAAAVQGTDVARELAEIRHELASLREELGLRKRSPP